jgi:homogentisate 1,2-dioxygenase
MLERQTVGEVPPKPHIIFRDAEGRLRYEHCFTRRGFDTGYTILYHRRPPTAEVAVALREEGGGAAALQPQAAPPQPLARRHLLTSDVAPAPDLPRARTPLLFNDDVILSIARPTGNTEELFVNGDADELFFVHRGGGLLETAFGPLAFREGDYVWVPCGAPYRVRFDGAENHLLIIEGRDELGIPPYYRNDVGQFKLDAPYSHRDFRRPTTLPAPEEGAASMLVKKEGLLSRLSLSHSPFDVVGWDGTVYPFAFSIYDFQPKTGLVHLPPPVHTTFAAAGFVVCSFVPRKLDTHPQAIPCPYAHSSVHADEVLFYVRGNFASRRGVGPASISVHPAGVPHGPHPGAYEGSIGATETEELAVMLDTFRPLRFTTAALALEDPNYPLSWAR